MRKDLSSGVVKLELPVSCLLPVGGSLSAVEGTEAKTERIIEVKENWDEGKRHVHS